MTYQHPAKVWQTRLGQRHVSDWPPVLWVTSLRLRTCKKKSI